jgi:hypothetical protein
MVQGRSGAGRPARSPLRPCAARRRSWYPARSQGTTAALGFPPVRPRSDYAPLRRTRSNCQTALRASAATSTSARRAPRAGCGFSAGRSWPSYQIPRPRCPSRSHWQRGGAALGLARRLTIPWESDPNSQAAARGNVWGTTRSPATPDAANGFPQHSEGRDGVCAVRDLQVRCICGSC